MASDFDLSHAVASVYAESLLQLASEAGQADAIAEELSELKQLWHAEPAFALMMSSVAIDVDARRESIRRVFGSGRVSPMVLNLMLVMNDKRRSMILPHVCDAYRHKLDEQRGRGEVFVTTAVPLDDAQREKIRNEVKRLHDTEAILVETVEPSLLGGMMIHVGDRLYDITIRRRLRDMRAGLLASAERNLRDAASRFVLEG